MDQFSHDLTVALEETSLLDRVNRWGQRRRTRSTGNLPCAPQPTEDSSSSPTDMVTVANPTNADGLNIKNVTIPSDSDDLRIPCNSLNVATRLGTLESDSLNETFSPARFFKANARRKRKLKRISVEYEITAQNISLEPSLPNGTGTVRKRLLKQDFNRSNIFFCGKRKRSNRDRYQDYEQSKMHSTSVPRRTYLEEWEECHMRPRSYSSTSKPQSDRLLPLNKGLLSKIEKISQQQKTDSAVPEIEVVNEPTDQLQVMTLETYCSLPLVQQKKTFQQNHHKKNANSRRRTELRQLQFAVDNHPMDCGELNDFLSSSSLSSSDSDDVHTANDTDREGDDELTDWPGNEIGGGSSDNKYDSKRKLTKKSTLSQIKSEEGILEDDTLMSGSREWLVSEPHEVLEIRYQPSEPIAIASKSFDLIRGTEKSKDDMNIPLKQIESEMSGETSNPFMSSPPCQPTEVREIRAGCRRVKDERPGFSIKTSVNERLARFLQDPRQTQIRLPDIEIYEHDSLVNLATLYSLQMSLNHGCVVLTKTSNTTQSVTISQQGLQSRLFLSDFKRRCYDGKETFIPRK